MDYKQKKPRVISGLAIETLRKIARMHFGENNVHKVTSMPGYFVVYISDDVPESQKSKLLEQFKNIKFMLVKPDEKSKYNEQN